MLSLYTTFKNLGTTGKVTMMEKLNGCVLCSYWTGAHTRENCPSIIRGKPFSNFNMSVGVAECVKKHNILLHGSTAKICNVVVRNRTIPPSRSTNFVAPSKEEVDQADTSRNVLLPMQQILVEGVGEKEACVVFFDTRSNINLVCSALAKKLGLLGTPVTQHLQVMRKQPRSGTLCLQDPVDKEQWRGQTHHCLLH